MPASLSAHAVAQYERDGYCAPLRAISPAAAADALARLDAFEAGCGQPVSAVYRTKLHLVFTWLDELVHAPAVLDAVESVLGPDLLCWSSSFFAKRASSAGYVSWHQDATYWGLSHPDVLTAWIAFTESDPDNGCLRVVPGTHRGQVAHRDTFDPANMLSRGQEIAVEVDEADGVDIVLAPGEMSLHHVLLVHGSRPNLSSRPRVGFAIRFIPTHVRQVAGPRDSATLVRGVDRYGHFDLEPRPPRDLDPDMLALHARLTGQVNRILYRGTDRAPA